MGDEMYDSFLTDFEANSNEYQLDSVRDSYIDLRFGQNQGDDFFDDPYELSSDDEPLF